METLRRKIEAPYNGWRPPEESPPRPRPGIGRRTGPRPCHQGPGHRRRRSNLLPRPGARLELQGRHGQRADAHPAAGDFGGGLDAGAGYFGGVYRGSGVGCVVMRAGLVGV